MLSLRDNVFDSAAGPVSGAPVRPAANRVDTAAAMAQTVHLVPLSPLSLPPPALSDSARPPAPPPATGDFGAFFRATLAPLRRYVARLVGSPEEAKDIAQDAYAKVYAVMRTREIEHPQALLFSTARNLAIDELRHRERSPFAGAVTDAAPSAAPGIEATVMAREEAALLARAIDQLPADCRDVLLLRTGEHLTHEEVGARLGLTKKQAEKRLHRAVRLLHHALHAPAAPR